MGGMRRHRMTPRLPLFLVPCVLMLHRSSPAACDQTSSLKFTMPRSFTWPTIEPQLLSIDAPADGAAAGKHSGAEEWGRGLERAGGPEKDAQGDAVVGSTNSWGGKSSLETFKPSVPTSPLADSIQIVKELERQHLLQAARCRSVIRRMLILERIAMSRGQYQSKSLPSGIAREIVAWQGCAREISQQMEKTFKSGAVLTMSKLLESAVTLSADLGLNATKPSKLYRKLSPSPSRQQLLADAAGKEWGMDLEARLVRRRWQQPYKSTFDADSIPAGDTPLPLNLEERFRVATWHGMRLRPFHTLLFPKP